MASYGLLTQRGEQSLIPGMSTEKSKKKSPFSKDGELLKPTRKILIPDKAIFKDGNKWAFRHDGMTYTAPLNKKLLLEMVLQTGTLPSGKKIPGLSFLSKILEKSEMSPEDREEMKGDLKVMFKESSPKRNIYKNKHKRLPLELTSNYTEMTDVWLKR